MRINPLDCIDFYKSGHVFQYPKGTTKIYSNFTARSDRLFNSPLGNDHKIVFFGLQYFVKGFLMIDWQREFFQKPKAEVVARYKRRMDNALGKDAIPTEHIEALHDLGHLPIRIKALDEGTQVPIRTPVLTIVNTHPDFYWVVNYLESIMSNMLWKSCTSATIAYEYKKLLTKAANATGAPMEFVQFQAHDFSFRGMSGIQDAVMSGGGHLTSFVGTDTVPAIDFLETYYNADSDKELVGCSVPATEHSVCSLGSCSFSSDVYGVEESFNETTGLWEPVSYHDEKMQKVYDAKGSRIVSTQQPI